MGVLFVVSRIDRCISNGAGYSVKPCMPLYLYRFIKESYKPPVMPTALRIGPYRFFFYSNENGEPHHIHVQRENALAKFWLRPVSLAGSSGFSAQELNRLRAMVEEHQQSFVEAWDEFFGP